MEGVARELYDGCASLELAEALAAEYSTAAMQQLVTRGSARGRLRSAWSHVEYGVNQSGLLGEFDRQQSIDCAQTLIASVLSKKEAHLNTHLEALVLASYIPIFRKRADNQGITGEDCTGVYESLAAAFSYLKPLRHDTTPSTVALEALVLAASARTQSPSYLLYPTSPREEASTLREVNHDSYFVRGDTKLPIQQKLVATPVRYADSITMLTLLPIAAKASRKSGYVLLDDDSDLLNNAIALVVAEASGEELEKHEKVFLDTLSASVVAHYREADARLGTPQAA